MGKKSWRETFGTIIVKFRSFSRSKLREFDPWSHIKRTEPKFWSHTSQKNRFLIFGHGAPKMVKKSLRETIGVKLRSEILSPGKNFIFWPNWCDVQCHPCTLVAECHPGTSDSLWNFTPVVRKVSPQDFLPVLGALRPKITNLSDRCATKWCFWSACDQNLGSVILWCYCGSNFRNFDLERLRTFTPMVPKVSLQNFLLILGAPRPKITIRSFWPACDQNQGSVLLTVVRLFPYLGSFD